MSMTVTVLFYIQDESSFSLHLQSEVLRDLPVSANGRVILPDSFRNDKTIMAVIKGEAEVLNTLGERANRHDYDSLTTG